VTQKGKTVYFLFSKYGSPTRTASTAPKEEVSNELTRKSQCNVDIVRGNGMIHKIQYMPAAFKILQCYQ
jgi:hypothetical protein